MANKRTNETVAKVEVADVMPAPVAMVEGEPDMNSRDIAEREKEKAQQKTKKIVYSNEKRVPRSGLNIPADIRGRMGLLPGTSIQMDIEVDENGNSRLIITKRTERCAFCGKELLGSEMDPTKYVTNDNRTVHICSDCLKSGAEGMLAVEAMLEEDKDSVPAGVAVMRYLIKAFGLGDNKLKESSMSLLLKGLEDGSISNGDFLKKFEEHLEALQKIAKDGEAARTKVVEADVKKKAAARKKRAAAKKTAPAKKTTTAAKKPAATPKKRTATKTTAAKKTTAVENK